MRPKDGADGIKPIFDSVNGDFLYTGGSGGNFFLNKTTGASPMYPQTTSSATTFAVPPNQPMFTNAPNP
jgi:hypothetical protein